MKRTLIKTAIWLLTAVSAFFIFTRTGAAAAIADSSTGIMAIELAVVFLWIFLAQYIVESPRIGGILILFMIYMYLWLHRIAVPVLLSGLYLAALMTSGEALLMLTPNARPVSRILRGAHDFVLGSALQIAVTCLLNAFGIGGVSTARMIALGLLIASLALIVGLRYTRKSVELPIAQLPPAPEQEKEKKSKAGISLAFALMITMVLLQAGRLNLELDYDSLHYGLRSPFILDAGRGIYQNLGSVNDVYVYPKALEVLVLPLNTGVTCGMVLSFSLWMAVGVLFLVYEIVRSRSTRKNALYAAVLVSCIPGVMNMGISAKTDIITLLFQLIMIADILVYITERTPGSLLFAASAGIMTVGLKPTAALFTGIIAVTAAGYLLCCRKQNADAAAGAELSSKTAGGKMFPADGNGFSAKQTAEKAVPVTDCCYSGNRQKLTIGETAAILLPSVLATAGITARTLLLTGLPLTSVGTSVFTALGWVQKYPFARVSTFGGGAGSAIKRLIALFACPVGEENIHIYIAWGSLIVTVLLMASLVKIIREPKKDSYLKLLLTCVFLASVIVTLVLWQVDGNYFILLYVLAVIVGFDGIDISCLFPAMALAIVMCMLTSWAGIPGLTEPKLNHYGFYDHASDRYDRAFAGGYREIYEYLERDPSQRVMALAEQPLCFELACNVQSYTDLEGSGGNVALVKTLDEFKRFLAYAQTQYIYTNDTFLQTHGRGREIIGYMAEDGSLEILIDEGENKLYQIQY